MFDCLLIHVTRFSWYCDHCFQIRQRSIEMLLITRFDTLKDLGSHLDDIHGLTTLYLDHALAILASQHIEATASPQLSDIIFVIVFAKHSRDIIDEGLLVPSFFTYNHIALLINSNPRWRCFLT